VSTTVINIAKHMQNKRR